MKKFVLAILLLAMFATMVNGQEFGLELYSFRKQFEKDIPGTLAMVKRMGVREVELAGTYGLSAEAFKKLLDENKLKVISTGSDFEKLESDPQTVANEAMALGAKYVVCFWVPHVEGGFTLEEANRAIKVFNAAGKVLKENGLSLCYHAHGYEFRPYENGTMFDYLAKNMDPKFANFEMDLYWIKTPGQDPVALLNKYPGRFLLMHLKDRKPGTPNDMNGRSDVEANVVLGTGDVGIAEAVKAGRATGVKHFFIEDESSRSETQVPQSLAFLKGLKN